MKLHDCETASLRKNSCAGSNFLCLRPGLRISMPADDDLG